MERNHGEKALLHRLLGGVSSTQRSESIYTSIYSPSNVKTLLNIWHTQIFLLAN